MARKKSTTPPPETKPAEAGTEAAPAAQAGGAADPKPEPDAKVPAPAEAVSTDTKLAEAVTEVAPTAQVGGVAAPEEADVHEGEHDEGDELSPQAMAMVAMDQFLSRFGDRAFSLADIEQERERLKQGRQAIDLFDRRLESEARRLARTVSIVARSAIYFDGREWSAGDKLRVEPKVAEQLISAGAAELDEGGDGQGAQADEEQSDGLVQR